MNRERPVEAELLTDVLDILFGSRLASHGRGRVAGEAEQRKRDQRDADQHQNGDSKTLQRIEQHRVTFRPKFETKRGAARMSRAPFCCLAYFHLAWKKRGISSGVGVKSKSFE